MGSGQCIGRAMAATVALAVVSGPVTAATCRLVRIGELQVTTAHNQPLAAVSINGHAARMLVDSGAGKSALWRPALESLGLSAVHSDVKFRGAGGADEADIVTVRDLVLGGYPVHDIRLFVIGRTNATFAGLLGEDFLSKLDVEFDLSSQVIRLFTPRDCHGDEVVYWAKAYSMVPLVRRTGTENWPLVPVQLNGRDALALLDTGATSSAVTSEFVRRPGMASESAPTAAAPAHGITAQSLDSAVAVFPTFTIGQEQIQNVKLRIADLFGGNRETVTGSLIPVDTMNAPDLIIGADFFLAHRVYLARSQGKVYFTYYGGTIFQTETPALSAPNSPTAAPHPAANGERAAPQQ
jgi:predicted aspartyl protease